MRCIALEDGHDGNNYINMGEFDVADEKIAKADIKDKDGNVVIAAGMPVDGSTWYQSLAKFNADNAEGGAPKPKKSTIPPGAGPKAKG